MREVATMIEPQMKQLQGHNIKINAAVWEGGEKVILCVHGITANCRTWDLMANTLIPDYSVVAIDLRGRGKSDKPPEGYSPDHHINDILSVMKDLGVEKIILMGHSLGAFIGLNFAARHPDKIEKLILVDGAGDLTKEQMDDVFEGIKPALDRLNLTFDSKESYLETMKSSPYIQPWLPHIEIYYMHEIEETPEGFKTNISPAHIMEESGNVRKIDCASLYGSVFCPVLILRATEGLISQNVLLLPEDVTQMMQTMIDRAQRFDVQNVNHYGIVFQPHQDRDQAIREFLAV